MEGKSVLMITVIVLLALGVVAAIAYVSLLEQPVITEIPFEGKGEIELPPATGDIDDVVASLEGELLDTELLFLEEEGDTLLITSDETAIDNFGQSADESEL